MKQLPPLTHNDITLRLITLADKANYYQDGFTIVDSESTYLTGSEDSYTKQAVDKFVDNSIASPQHYLLLLIAPNGTIIGESVLNCIDYNTSSCNFRIIIWNKHYRNKGIGTWAMLQTVAIAFDTLQLNTVELDVYSFNPRAIALYTKAGFEVAYTTYDAPCDSSGNPAQEIHMTLSKDKWANNKI